MKFITKLNFLTEAQDILRSNDFKYIKSIMKKIHKLESEILHRPYEQTLMEVCAYRREVLLGKKKNIVKMSEISFLRMFERFSLEYEEWMEYKNKRTHNEK